MLINLCYSTTIKLHHRVPSDTWHEQDRMQMEGGRAGSPRNVEGMTVFPCAQ
jgi:hypothetical protein